MVTTIRSLSRGGRTSASTRGVPQDQQGRSKPVELVVLGSGRPILAPARPCSGYLINER